MRVKPVMTLLLLHFYNASSDKRAINSNCIYILRLLVGKDLELVRKDLNQQSQS